MILVDTSVWVDHLRSEDRTLANLLNAASVLAHPFVIGEIALGHLRQRKVVLELLQKLPQAVAATDIEALKFINENDLAGMGIGYVDAHLLAATRLTAGASLWSRDKRLQSTAHHMGLAMKQ